MNMSTDEALKYLAEHQPNVEVEPIDKVEVEPKEEQSSAQPSEETKAIAEPASDTADDTKADKPRDEKEDRQNIDSSAGSDESAEDRDEKAEDNGKEPEKTEKPGKTEQSRKGESLGKKERTHQEERDYAFIREKNKRKAQRERYEAEIKSLKEELEKYKGLKLEDFKGNQQEYIDYRIDQQKQEQKLADQERYLDELNAADMEAENDRRVNLSFADERERQEYVNLLEKNGREFLSALKQFDPENVVMTYLNDLEQYPRVLKVLMTDKEALRSVFAKRDPTFRKLALDHLATKILAPKTEKKKLPVIGRQTSSSPVAENKVHDMAYWNEYLRNHPKGR